MMIVLDANVLSLIIYPKSSVPLDFRTGRPILYAKERIDSLIAEIEASGDKILIPTPALSEALVVVAPDVQAYLDILSGSDCFQVKSFGTKAAVEVALRVKSAKAKGDKREGVVGEWDKIKYDRQIVAIAKAEGAKTVYSTDRDVHDHCKLWGIDVLNVSDIPIPEAQRSLYEPEQKSSPEAPADASAAHIRRSGNGHPESEAGTEEKKAEAESQRAEAASEEKSPEGLTGGDPKTEMVDGAGLEPAPLESQMPPPATQEDSPASSQ